jgi:ABC-type sugar transport system substrate-binding protein
MSWRAALSLAFCAAALACAPALAAEASCEAQAARLKKQNAVLQLYFQAKSGDFELAADAAQAAEERAKQLGDENATLTATVETLRKQIEALKPASALPEAERR